MAKCMLAGYKKGTVSSNWAVALPTYSKHAASFRESEY